MAQVLTGALAIIKLNGQAIGKMKNISVNENISRGKVQGIGKLHPSELPALEWSGTVSCSFYSIDFELDGVAGVFDNSAATAGTPTTGGNQGVIRKVTSVNALMEHIALEGEGVTLDIYKKIHDFTNATTGQKESDPNTQPIFAQIKGVHLERDSFEITENGISGRNQEFAYTEPIIFT